jgi:hypothetical protein
MKVRSTLLACAGWAAILLSAPQASGQIPIQYMEGKVSLDGQPIAIRRDKSSGLTYFPYLNNRQVLETANGRVWASPGLFLAENSSLKMLYDHEAELVIEIRSGSAIVDTTARAASVQYKGATMVLNKRGEYRIDADTGRLRVYHGEATVTYGVALNCPQSGACWLKVGQEPANTIEAHKGEQVGLTDALPVSTDLSDDKDAFKRWVARCLRRFSGWGEKNP